MFKKLTAALAALFVFATVSPVSADDMTQTLFGMNPISTWINQNSRDVRISDGTWRWHEFGSNTADAGHTASCKTVPVTGLLVAVTTANSNVNCSVHNLLAESPSALGGFPSGTGTVLNSDSTQIDVAAILPAGTSTASIGPMLAGSSGGQSISNLIECQAVAGQLSTDTTNQAINIVSPLGVVTSTTGNRDRVDRPTCQFKSSSSAVSPTTPTVDSGWVAISAVVVPNGTVTVTTGMISPVTSQQFFGFGQLGSNGTLPVAQGGTGSTTQNFVDLTNPQTVAGIKTFSSAPVLSGASITAGSVSIGAGGAQTGVLPLANGGTGSSSQNFVDLSNTQSVGGQKTFTASSTSINSQLNVTTSNGVVEIGTSGTNNSSGGVYVATAAGTFSQLSASNAATLGAVNCGLFQLALIGTGSQVCVNAGGDMQLNGNLYLGTNKSLANSAGAPIIQQVSTSTLAIQTATSSGGNINFGNQALGNAYGSVSTTGYTPPSARRFKYDIKPYQQDALSLIDRTDTEQFCYLVTRDGKPQPKCTEPIYGIVADDSPWPIANKTHDGFQSTQATGVLIRAVQELHGELNADEAQLRLLEGLVAVITLLMIAMLVRSRRRV